MENCWLKVFFLKIRYGLLLNKIYHLEREGKFITPFFCGYVNYPIMKERYEIKLEILKKKLEQIQQKIKLSEEKKQ